ncbi:hypothetical protein [Tenacibaculum sp. 190524A05c]|uniref:hypothetical protein n=1 Tax=Tenacibaculum platacis TaxID=3137852 RepID=UPI0032B2569B
MFGKKKKKVQFAQELDYFVIGKLSAINIHLHVIKSEGIPEEDKKKSIETCIQANSEIQQYLREKYEEELKLSLKNERLPLNKRIKRNFTI